MSDRYDDARKVLAEWDATAETYREGMMHDVAAALRSLITPPEHAGGDTIDQVAERFDADIRSRGTSRALGTRAIVADASVAERTEKRRHDLGLAFRAGLRAGAQFERTSCGQQSEEKG